MEINFIMNIDDCFNLNIENSELFGAHKNVIYGEHGLSINDKGEHFASHFHLKTIISKGEMKKFLNENVSSGKVLSDLMIADNQSFSDLLEVQYEGDNYRNKKYKIEWLFEYYKRFVNLTKNQDKQKLEKDLIEEYVISKLKLILVNKFYSKEESSYINDIKILMERNSEQFDILAQSFLLGILELTFKKVYDTSRSFKNNYDNWLKGRGEYVEYKGKPSIKLYQILNYCFKNGIITHAHKTFLDELRNYRNSMLHTGLKSKEDASVIVIMSGKTLDLVMNIQNLQINEN